MFAVTFKCSKIDQWKWSHLDHHNQVLLFNTVVAMAIV